MERNYRQPWQEKLSAVKIKKSALKLAQIIAGTDGGLEKHKKELLGILIWKITEANGKYNTRFVSMGVCNGKKPVEFEHVFTRKYLIQQILERPKDVSSILKKAIGCLVTKKEHEILRRRGKGVGWERYRSTSIKVFDRKDRRWLR